MSKKATRLKMVDCNPILKESTKPEILLPRPDELKKPLHPLDPIFLALVLYRVIRRSLDIDIDRIKQALVPLLRQSKEGDIASIHLLAILEHRPATQDLRMTCSAFGRATSGTAMS